MLLSPFSCPEIHLPAVPLSPPPLKLTSTSALSGLEDFSVRYFKDFKLNFSEVLIYLDQSLMLKLNFSREFITEKSFKCPIHLDLSIHTFFLPVIAFI